MSNSESELEFSRTGVTEAADRLIVGYPQLAECRISIIDACERIIKCYIRDGIVLICGNGGSASDSGHIVGELMKGFRKKRPLSEGTRNILQNADTELGLKMSETLQQPLRAIDLTAHNALFTAFANDQSPDAAFAQQVLAFSRSENVLIGLSTSGNSKNVVNAAFAAKALGLTTVSLTGSGGGELAKWSDVLIAVPETDTAAVQELHLPIYHAICTAVESHFFET